MFLCDEATSDPVFQTVDEDNYVSITCYAIFCFLFFLFLFLFCFFVDFRQRTFFEHEQKRSVLLFILRLRIWILMNIFSSDPLRSFSALLLIALSDQAFFPNYPTPGLLGCLVLTFESLEGIK